MTYASTTTLNAIRKASPCCDGWTKFCECGCGNPAPVATRTNKVKGAKKGEYQRFLPGHNRRGTFDLDRFEARDCGYPTPCWIWTGPINRKGYGRVQVNRVQKNAHRAVYEARIGSIPRHLHLDHLCRNKLCVNPLHMEPVTPAENNRRKFTVSLAPARVEAVA